MSWIGCASAVFCYRALQAEPRIGLMLPCNVIVRECGEGRVEIAAIDPVASMAAVENDQLRDIGNEVRAKLRRVIESI